MNDFKIYGLKEPHTEMIRYIGLTGHDLQKRLSEHLIDNKISHRRNWIVHLKNNGISPDIVLIEDGLTKEQSKQKEIDYIKLF